MKGRDERYPDYPLFKGLQRPLEFMGIQGRYIYWAAGSAGGAIVGFVIAYCLAGFVPDWWYWPSSCLRASRSSSSSKGKAFTPRRTGKECMSMPARRRYEKRKSHDGERVAY